MRLNPGEVSKEQGRPHPGPALVPADTGAAPADGVWTASREWAQGWREGTPGACARTLF